MIRLKAGVTPPNLLIAAAAANVGAEMGVDVTITAGTDGKHMVGSKHYICAALDIRLLGSQTNEFMVRLKQHLGSAFQVLLEKDHIHVEYDPK